MSFANRDYEQQQQFLRGCGEYHSEREPYVDAKTVARYLHNQLNPKTIQRYAREGRIPAYAFDRGKKRKTWLFLLSEIDEWLKTMNRGHVREVQ